MIRLPQYGDANVVLDPRRGYGQPVFDGSGVRVADVLGPLRAGATFQAVADDYGVTPTSFETRSTPLQPDRNLLADLDHIFVDRSLGAVQVRNSFGMPDSG